MSPEVELNKVKTNCTFVVLVGENLPNHSMSLQGLSKFVRISGFSQNNNYPIVRTRQEAYRLAAHLLANSQDLPHEDLPSTWDEVLDAVLEVAHMTGLDTDYVENGEEENNGD